MTFSIPTTEEIVSNPTPPANGIGNSGMQNLPKAFNSLPNSFMSTALTTQEHDHLLSLARAQVGRPRLPDYPTLKMRNAKSSLKDVEKGAYCIVRKVEKDGTMAEDIQAIDGNPELIILKRRYSYSYYDEEMDSLVAWTNELDGFTPDQTVKLARKGPNGKEIQTFNWPKFKEWKKSDPLGQKLGFKNILYVCLGLPKVENLARLFVSNASVTGVKDGEKTGDYKNPLPGSFIDFEKPLSWSGSSYLERVCQLGSKWLDQNEYYLMTFTDIGENKNIADTLPLFKLLMADLQMRYLQDFGADAHCENDTEDLEPFVIHQPGVRVEELPF